MRYFADIDGQGYVLGIVRVLPEGAAPSVLPEIAEAPLPRPSPHARLRLIGGVAQWVDERTVEQAKRAKAAELRAAAGAEIASYWDEIGEMLGMLANGQTPPALYRARMGALRDRVQARRAALQAATTLQDVDAVVW